MHYTLTIIIPNNRNKDCRISISSISDCGEYRQSENVPQWKTLSNPDTDQESLIFFKQHCTVVFLGNKTEILVNDFNEITVNKKEKNTKLFKYLTKKEHIALYGLLFTESITWITLHYEL